MDADPTPEPNRPDPTDIEATPAKLRNPDLAPGALSGSGGRQAMLVERVEKIDNNYASNGHWSRDDIGPRTYVPPVEAQEDAGPVIGATAGNAPAQQGGAGRQGKSQMTRRKFRSTTASLWIAVGAVALTVGGLAYARSTERQKHRPADSAPGRTAKRDRFGDYKVTGRTVTIHRTRQEVYDLWRDFANLARVMENIVSVEPLAGGDSRWVIGTSDGETVSVDTRIIEDRPGESIAWRSVGGSQIETEGKVMFRDGPADRGTEVEAIIAYKPPAGMLGGLIAKLFGKDPKIRARQDLKRLKMLMETGEIATSSNRKSA